MGVDGHHVCPQAESKDTVTVSSKLAEGYVIFAQPAQHLFHLLKQSVVPDFTFSPKRG